MAPIIFRIPLRSSIAISRRGLWRGCPRTTTFGRRPSPTAIFSRPASVHPVSRKDPGILPPRLPCINRSTAPSGPKLPLCHDTADRRVYLPKVGALSDRFPPIPIYETKEGDLVYPAYRHADMQRILSLDWDKASMFLECHVTGQTVKAFREAWLSNKRIRPATSVRGLGRVGTVGVAFNLRAGFAPLLRSLPASLSLGIPLPTVLGSAGAPLRESRVEM